MKSHWLILTLTFCLLLTGQLQAQNKQISKENLHVYLLIGQSNMAGRAPFSGDDAKVISGCLLLNDQDQWEDAKNPLNLYSSVRKKVSMQKMNPGYMFAKTMLKANPKNIIGLVVNAKGGTRIQLWAKGTEFYNQAIRRTKIAQQTGTLKGILWHQGEANCKDAKYLERITALITNLRKDLNAPNLPFIAGQINCAKEYPFNTLILKLPKQVPHTGVASSQDLVAMDNWHFDTPSMKKLGERYAKQMMKVQNAKTH